MEHSLKNSFICFFKKPFIKTFGVLILMFVLSNLTLASSGVVVTGSVSSDGTYADLNSAINAVNSVSQTGADIEIRIDSSTTEPSSGIVINSNAWNSLKIFPKTGAAVTVSGAITPGQCLLNINGADNIIIDGINEGGTSLTFVNTVQGNAANSATIKLQNDAVNNKICRVSILGSYTSPLFQTSANLIIGTTGVTTGNDNNVISDCSFGKSPELPTGSTCSILLRGSTFSQTVHNSGDTIRNCNITDFFNENASSAGIYIGIGNRETAVLNNKFYSPAVSLLGIYKYNAILVESDGGGAHVVSGNIIGHANDEGTGMMAITGGESTFYPIEMYYSGDETLIENNVISGISITGAFDYEVFTGINLNGGDFKVIGNTIGSMTENNSIVITTDHRDIDITGIKYSGQQTCELRNNNIGGISISNSAFFRTAFTGLMTTTMNGANWKASNNIIGSELSNSILLTNPNNTSYIYGIHLHNGIQTTETDSNIIRNMTISEGSIIGIREWKYGGSDLIRYNSIYSLTTNSSFPSVSVIGIYLSNTTGNSQATGNLIRWLNHSSQWQSIMGFDITSGNCKVVNNMIILGQKQSGETNGIGSSIIGINERNTPCEIYYNSVLICGTVTSFSNYTAAFFSTSTSDRFYKNNIFCNTRTNAGGGGNHFATYSISGVNRTSDYNLFYVNPGNNDLALHESVLYSTLAAYQSGSSGDLNSVGGDPLFISDTDLHIDTAGNSPVYKKGIPVAGHETDFDLQTRSLSLPSIGADEYFKGGMISGEVLSLDGTDDFVELPAEISSMLTAPSVTEFTIEYWFKGSDLQSALRIQNGSDYIIAGYGSPGNQKLVISSEGGTSGVSLGSSVTDGNWHHIAMTYKKNTFFGFRAYVDGIIVGGLNTSNNSLPAINTSAIIGKYNNGPGSEFFNGTIDELRIWTKERNSSDINLNKNVKISQAPGLIASYHFDQGIAGENNAGVTTLIDSSGNNFNGTLNNFALDGTTSNWIAPGPVFVIPQPMRFSVTIIPQGFYNISTNQLNSRDTIKAFICYPFYPYIPVDSAIGILDSVTFKADFEFNTIDSGDYYLMILHRNSVETWSGESIWFTDLSSYDFTDSQSKFYESNGIQVSNSPVRYAMYSGDVTRDGLVNLNDIVAVYNATSAFASGYLPSDVTGDNITNLNDIAIVYNNTSSFVKRETPWPEY